MHPHCNLVQIAFALSNQRMDTKIEHTVILEVNKKVNKEVNKEVKKEVKKAVNKEVNKK